MKLQDNLVVLFVSCFVREIKVLCMVVYTMKITHNTTVLTIVKPILYLSICMDVVVHRKSNGSYLNFSD